MADDLCEALTVTTRPLDVSNSNGGSCLTEVGTSLQHAQVHLQGNGVKKYQPSNGCFICKCTLCGQRLETI